MWFDRVNKPFNNNLWVFYEEAEGLLKLIRGDASESIFRLVHVARNKPVQIRCCLITVDLALLDASVIRQCGIRFHGFLNVEENSKRKFRSYYGKDYARIAFEGLEAGDFIRLHKRKVDIISVPLFKRKNVPKQTFDFKKEEEKPVPVPQKIGFWKTLKSIFFQFRFF